MQRLHGMLRRALAAEAERASSTGSSATSRHVLNLRGRSGFGRSALSWRWHWSATSSCPGRTTSIGPTRSTVGETSAIVTNLTGLVHHSCGRDCRTWTRRFFSAVYFPEQDMHVSMLAATRSDIRC
ncbi:MAG: hypothetical protein WBV37_08000 [Nocardioidaceae bacterium]